uniref:Uncharacterized protein n=1 Tax=Onchocerca volvulus TaxID=6282 RepID=A0A8R1U0B9_ONCVO
MVLTVRATIVISLLECTKAVLFVNEAVIILLSESYVKFHRFRQTSGCQSSYSSSFISNRQHKLAEPTFFFKPSIKSRQSVSVGEVIDHLKQEKFHNAIEFR